jgi:AraC family transcriptional regulator
MTRNASNTVKQALDGAGARRLNECVLNQNLTLALWSNRDVTVNYHRVGHHTLSLYLRGGYKTRRLDQRERGFGAPGKLCLMPAAQDSQWQVGEYQEFVHLYISDAGLKHFALESFDCDPRRVELPDLTFFEHAPITAACERLLQTPWVPGNDRLQLQQTAYEIMGELIQAYVKTKGGYAKGGLSRSQLNRVCEFIAARYAGNISLEDLAEVAGLSRFHFARMFKLSTGLTPHQYISKVRVREGLKLLQAGVSQAEAASRCGFAHQSHFAAHFKRVFGMAPGQYLRNC